MSDFPKCSPVTKAAKLRWRATDTRGVPGCSLKQTNNRSPSAGAIAVMGRQTLAVITPLLWITSGAAALAGCGEGFCVWVRAGGWCVLGGGGRRGLFSTADSADRPRKEAFPQPHQRVRGHVSAAASFCSAKLTYQCFIHY